MIEIEDLLLLERWFFREEFRPEENSITWARVALAVSHCSAEWLQSFFEKLPPDRAQTIVRLLSDGESQSDEDRLAAQLELIGVYFWDLVYRKYPAEYESFCTCQKIDLGRLFPIPTYKRKVVVDVGCGTGRLVEHLRPHAARIFAVDPVSQMLSVCRDRFRGAPHVTLVSAGFRDWPFAEGSVDHVVSNLAFRFEGKEKGRETICRLKRTVRPGGGISLTVGNVRSQDLLLKEGFHERFVPGAMRFRMSPTMGLVGRCLYRLSIRSLENPSEDPAFGGRTYMCSANGWSFGWSLKNLPRTLKEPWHHVFHGGQFKLPTGLPVYCWSKA